MGVAGLLAVLALSAGLLGFTNVNAKGKGTEYTVTVTNITRGQIISPSVVYTHDRRAEPLFALGGAASDELAQLAEDAVIQPLIDALNNDSMVQDVQVIFGEVDGAPGPILPGESASVTVQAASRSSEVTVAGMLVSTNDAFFALQGERVSIFSKMKSRLVPAYDSGTEANTEMCEHIPGPPCGNELVRVTDGAEGYVYIHPGIFGSGALTAEHDWNNPVAMVTIERVK